MSIQTKRQHRRLIMRNVRVFMGIVSVISFLGLGESLEATVFYLPHFVEPGRFAVGLQPEFHFAPSESVGVELRYTYGLSEVQNLTAILGTGSGIRQFRWGGQWSLDWFPDTDRQPGLGLALQACFVQGKDIGFLENQIIPYLHKSWLTSQGKLEPFLAIPVGFAMVGGLSAGFYQSMVSVVVGSLFEHHAHLSSVIEFGMSFSQATTYLAGGVVYYY